MITTADQNMVRKFNTAVVLDALRRQAPLSRAELSQHTGLTRSTISSIIQDLLNQNLVQETTFQSDRVGRPGMQLELNPAGGFAVGIELGVDFISLVVTDFVANVLWRSRVLSNPSDGQDAILEQAFALTHQALVEGQARGLRPLGIGLGVPGLVDLRQGELMLAPNLGWKNTPLRGLWSQRFDLPVFVENDGNASALGEYYLGVARGLKNFIYLSADVGLGAGILLDGKLFRGSHGFAAEVGHMTTVPGGELCGCGKRGCWETQVGPRAVVRYYKQALLRRNPGLTAEELNDGLEGINFESVLEAARQNDSIALAALHEVAVSLGIGIANLVNIFNPQLVVLGGALVRAIDVLLPIIQQEVESNALRLSNDNLRIVTSAYGVDACVMGAAALVLDDILREPALA